MTDKASLTRSAAYASIATALFLAGLKLWATARTGSTAMLGSLADTALDHLMDREWPEEKRLKLVELAAAS